MPTEPQETPEPNATPDQSSTGTPAQSVESRHPAAGPESEHPSRAVLSAYSLGSLSAAAAAAIEPHIQNCAACARSLQDVSDDSFIQLARDGFALADAETRLSASPADAEPGAQKDADPPQPSPTPEPPEPPPDLARLERYRILERLGAGGMGTVFRAEHRLLHRDVALKIIHPERLRQPEWVERFHREAELAAQLNHPHIVAVLDAEQVGNTHMIVQEYVPGETLAQRVAREGPLPPAQVRAIAVQVARGLQHAHEHGLIHRDIKPQNLLVSEQGLIKIADFGLARLSAGDSHEITAENQVLGSADYIAPEQVDSPAACDIRADLYSLGCTLYFLLTAHPPFAGMSLLQKLRAHGAVQPPDLLSLRPDLNADPALVRIIETLMAKDPAQRFPTPAACLAALERADPAPPPRKPGRRWRGLAASLIACLLLTGASALVYRIVTAQGELVITTDDPSVSVTISQNGRRLMVLDPRTRTRVTLSPGTYRLQPNDQSGSTVVWPESLTIERGARQIARIEHRTSAVPHTAPVLPSDDAVTPPAPAVTPDLLPLAPARGTPINLLALVKPAQHALQGIWHWADGSLMPELGSPAEIQIPYQPPAEYDLSAVVEKMYPEHGIDLGIPVAGRACYASVDAVHVHGGRSGLMLLDDLALHERSSGFASGQVLPPGIRVQLRCSVRQAGDQARVRLSADDRLLFDWQGDPRRLSGHFDTNPGEARWLRLRAWYSLPRIFALSLTPLSDQHPGQPGLIQGSLLVHKLRQVAEPAPPANTWVDLLARVDPDADALTGTWTRQDGALSTEGRNPSCLALPMLISGSYELELEFEIAQGQDGITVALPITDERAVSLELAAYRGACHGLSLVNRKPSFENPTTLIPGALETGQRHSLKVRLDRTPGLVDLNARLDDRELLRWAGPISQLDLPPSLNFWRFQTRPQPALVTRGNRILIHQARLRLLAPDAHAPIQTP